MFLIALLFLHIEIEVLKLLDVIVSNFSLVMKKVPIMIFFSSYICIVVKVGSMGNFFFSKVQT